MMPTSSFITLKVKRMVLFAVSYVRVGLVKIMLYVTCVTMKNKLHHYL